MIEIKFKYSLFIHSRKKRHLKFNSATVSSEERLNTNTLTQQIRQCLLNIILYCTEPKTDFKDFSILISIIYVKRLPNKMTRKLHTLKNLRAP